MYIVEFLDRKKIHDLGSSWGLFLEKISHRAASAPRSFSLCSKLGLSTWALLGFLATQVSHRHPGGNLVGSRSQRVNSIIMGDEMEERGIRSEEQWHTLSFSLFLHPIGHIHFGTKKGKAPKQWCFSPLWRFAGPTLIHAVQPMSNPKSYILSSGFHS